MLPAVKIRLLPSPTLAPGTLGTPFGPSGDDGHLGSFVCVGHGAKAGGRGEGTGPSRQHTRACSGLGPDRVRARPGPGQAQVRPGPSQVSRGPRDK